MSTISPLPARKRGPKFKISRYQALRIRRDYEGSPVTVEDLARSNGVTKQTIYNVIARLRKEDRHGIDPRWT